jgi:hypothetical protein
MYATRLIRCLSVSAIIGGLIVLATLVFLNLDGYHNEPFGPGGFYEEPPDINWTHGWPFVCMGRLSVGTGPLMLSSVQRTITNRWPFDDAQVTYVYRRYLYSDIAIVVVSVVATVWGINRLVRRLRARRRYGLRSVFVLTTIVAVIAAFGAPYLASRIIQYRIAIAILATANTVVIVSTVESLSGRLSRKSLDARSCERHF